MSISENHFNYPSLNRKDLMSLKTISERDEKIRKFKGGLNTNRNYSYNLFNVDLEKSSPKIFGELNNKTCYINKNDDIEKSHYKTLNYINPNKTNYNLSNADIPKSSPKCNFRNNRQPSNPLEPKYKLPVVETIPLPVSKFIRDNIQINDIEGTESKKFIMWSTKDRINVFDIEGTSPKRAKLRTASYSCYNYNDVTHDKFKSKRCTNPLDPLYEIKFNNEMEIYGKIEKSKPCTFLPFNSSQSFKQNTSELPDTQAGSKNKIKKFNSDNSNLIISDISGTQTSSIKKGLCTSRVTNPLNPVYILPGSKELINKNNNPFGTTYNWKTKNEMFKFEDNKNNEKDICSSSSNNHYIADNERVYEKNNMENIESAKCPDNQNKLNSHNNIEAPADNVPINILKPEQFYGYIHDKSIPLFDSNSRKYKDDVKKTSVITKTKNLTRSHSYDTFNKTMNHFAKTTYAQKLDSLICN